MQVYLDAFFSSGRDVSRLLLERAWRRDKSQEARRVAGNYNKWTPTASAEEFIIIDGMVRLKKYKANVSNRTHFNHQKIINADYYN